MEEKQSDVNVALEAVYDGVTDTSLEHIVFVTNDTDIIPALKKLRHHNEHQVRDPIRIGLIIPARKSDSQRRGNKSLKELADWTIEFIHNWELEQAQLPCRIFGDKRTAIKPTSWFKHAEKVEEILGILSQKGVEGSIPKAWKWLERPLHQADNLPNFDGIPAEHMDDEKRLDITLEHVKAYAGHRLCG